MAELLDILKTEYVKVTGAEVTSTSAAAPTVIATLNFNLAEAGTYFMGYSFQCDFNGTKDKLLFFRELHQGVPQEWMSGFAPAAAGNHRNRLYAYPKELPAGAGVMAIEMYKDVAIATMDVDFCDIFVMR